MVLTIFLGFIFILVGYMCFLFMPSNQDRITNDEVHYVPFQSSFKHIVVEAGWDISLFLGEGLNLGNEMFWLRGDEEKLKETSTKMAPNGIRMSKYYPGYDDKSLLSKIEIKNDTLFFRRIKVVPMSIRRIEVNLSTFSSLDVSGNSSVAIGPKRKYYEDDSIMNLGNFTLNTKEEAKIRISALAIDQLTLNAQGFSTVTLAFLRRPLTEGKRFVELKSDVSLSGSSVMEISGEDITLSNYEIEDEAILVHSFTSVETVYGKKFSKYYTHQLNKQTNASSTSSN